MIIEIDNKTSYDKIPQIFLDNIQEFNTHVSLNENPYDEKKIQDDTERLIKNSLALGFTFKIEKIDDNSTIIYRFDKDKDVDKIIGLIDDNLVFCFTNINEKTLYIAEGYKKIQNYLIEKGFEVDDESILYIDSL